MQGFRILTSRRLLLAASLAPLAALTACAGAPERQAAWPPSLNAASERMQAADTADRQRDRALQESGATVLADRPYH